jgi:hypothetical protein
MPIIKEQLASLQTGHLLFQGELFPGQQMAWRVAEREGGGQQDQEQQDAPWETAVSLTLPGLGAVEASLTLSGTRLSVQVSAGQPATAQLLDSGREELVDQLAAAGLELQSMVIKHGT